MSKTFGVVAFALSVSLLSQGCGHPPASSSPGGGDSVGTIAASLAGVVASGVAAVRVDVSLNGTIAVTRTIQRAPTSDAGAGVPFGDAFFVLPPALYQVTATPLNVDGQPTDVCAPARSAALVVATMTTEIRLTLACGGPSNGGLDVVVATSDPPVITGLTIDPSKFTATCAPVTLTVTAADPAGETLGYSWSIVSQPPPAGTDNPVTQLVPNGASATFFTDGAGDYTLQVVVTNTDKRTAHLSFPIHVIGSGNSTCNPRFDALNPWSPAGAAVENFTYGNRVHMFPVPGTVLPDPICHLTAHGGPYLPSPVIRPVLWGSSVRPTLSGPMVSLYTSLFTDPQFSTYLETMVQYTGVPTAGSVAPSVTITPLNTSTALSDADIQEELGKEIRLGVLPAPTGSDLYVVMLPASITGTLSGSGPSCVIGGFCAYHGSFQFNGVSATFAVMPDCGAGTCAVAGSHELIEAMTDPMIGFVGSGPGDNLAWYDDESAPCNGEIADLCQGDDYMLGGFPVAAAWSNQLGLCQTVALNPPACGIVGHACCAGNACNDANSGCDQTSTCVSCPPPAPTPTLLTQEEDTAGSNCLNEVNQPFTFGPSSCGAGLTRAFLKTTSLDVSSDASCIAHWVTNDPTDCRVQVDLHVPTDCSKHVDCVTQIFVTSGSLPSSAVRADLQNITDGHTTNPTHLYTIGGPCDPGFHRPDAPPIPTVSNAGSGQHCAANWADPTDPNDCTAVVTYTLGDLTKQITCDTQVVEIANPNVVPAGCP